jgi:hypothetical protein
MYPPEVRAQALALVEAGLNDSEISRRLALPRGTIRDWRRPTYQRKTPDATCPRCWRTAKPMVFTREDYSELLAMYLGDGCISEGQRTTRMRIALDTKYSGIIKETRALLHRCFPANPVGQVSAHGGTMVFLSVYSSHLPCLFPQHGPGLKHQRPILLESWQLELVRGAPWPFIRGCIRTDGCSFINRTDVHRAQPYEYLSYQFSNMSKDIVGLFVEACERVDVFTRVNCNAKGLWDVRINRRDSVARMVENVGIKA